MKRHFETDLMGRGIVVNREVEIRRGQETDIRVDAISYGPDGTAETVTAIVEVKGLSLIHI